MDTALKSRLEKIQRLMEGATSVGEAEAAAAAFQRLVMKHNVEAAELESLGTSTEDAFIFEHMDVTETQKTGIRWRLSLLHTLAKFNFCMIVRDYYLDGGLTIVGKESNVRAVQAMFLTMVPTFQRLAADSWKQTQLLYPVAAMTSGGRKYRKSFLLGVPSGLHDKFTAERKQELKETPHANAIVLLSDEQLKNAAEDYFGKLKTGKARSATVDVLGHKNGYDAGRNYSDAKPVRAGDLSLSSGS